MGWLTIMIDTSSWSPEQHKEAQEEIALYKKKLRPLIRNANLYHISPRPDGVHWDGVEYWDPLRQHGVVYAFRGTIKGENAHSFVLKGLTESGEYLLHSQDHTGPERKLTGRELMSSGVRVHLPLENSSDLVFIEQVTQ